jgi:predicted Fe-Mo cluster-binding NifX family protein
MNNLIAVGVNKADKIWAGHFGIAPYYQVYNTDGEMIEKRMNPHGAGQGHKHDHGDDQPLLIKEILTDCNIFIGKQMGEESKLKLAKKLGVKTILTEKSDPQEVVNEVISKIN